MHPFFPRRSHLIASCWKLSGKCQASLRVKQSVRGDLERLGSRVATIWRLEVKMAPGGSIYALKVGQSVSMARCQCSHVQNLPQLPSPPSSATLFFLSNYFLVRIHTSTWRRFHILIVYACLLIDAISKIKLSWMHWEYQWQRGYSSLQVSIS